jgi:predicted lipid carrier protein YhbT
VDENPDKTPLSPAETAPFSLAKPGVVPYFAHPFTRRQSTNGKPEGINMRWVFQQSSDLNQGGTPL